MYLTKEIVLAMEAGRQMDRLVGGLVMGLDLVEDTLPQFPKHYYPGFDRTVFTDVPKYSSDTTAAWEVLEKPEIMDRLQVGVYPTSFGTWIARPFMPGGKDCTVQDKSAALAICKCVLLTTLTE